MRYRVHILRDALRNAGLPECDFRAGLPVWGVPLDVTQSARADAITAEVLTAFPDPQISDAQWSAWEAQAAARVRRAWQDDLDGSADMRPLLVVARRLFQLVKSQHPGLALTFPQFVDQLKADLAAEPVPARAARNRS